MGRLLKIISLILFPMICQAQFPFGMFQPNVVGGIVYTTELDSIDAANRNTACVGTDQNLSYSAVGGYTAGQLEERGIEIPIKVPQGSTIDTVNLTVNVEAITGWTTTDTLMFKMYNVDSATVYASSATEYVHAHQALVADSIKTGGPTGQYAFYVSPNLARLLQVVVSRAGYIAGKHVGFVMTPKTTVTSHSFVVDGFSAGATYKPRLRIVYH